MDFSPEDFCSLCLKSSIDYDYVCSLKCNGRGRPSQMCFTRMAFDVLWGSCSASMPSCSMFGRWKGACCDSSVPKLLNCIVQMESFIMWKSC